MTTLTILVGMPACGKSTYASLSGDAVVSTDEIREKYFTGGDQTHNAAVFSIFHWTIRALLDAGRNTIADATNLTERSRSDLYEIAKARNAKTHVVFFANPMVARERNKTRVGWARVPDDAMDRMSKRFTETLAHLHGERWDHLTTVIPNA